MSKALKILLSILAVLAIIVIGGLLYLSSPYFIAKVGTVLTHRSGHNVTLEGGIEAHIWSLEPRFILHDVIGLDLFRTSGLLITGNDKPVPMNCVVGVFDVDAGIMKIRDFLIDTAITTIRGEGTANLKDETMDFRLHTFPKHPTPLSAHAPIVVTGTLKHPKAGPETAALAARGGVAAALALLAPPAAILAFIQPGLGKESHCAAFINTMEQHTGGKAPVNR